jgi:hypothetical protein
MRFENLSVGMDETDRTSGASKRRLRFPVCASRFCSHRNREGEHEIHIGDRRGVRSSARLDGDWCRVGTGASSLLLSGVLRQVYAARHFRIYVRQRLHAEVWRVIEPRLGLKLGQKRDQLGLPVRVGFGEHGLELIAHGLAREAELLGGLLRGGAFRDDGG